MVSHRKKKKEDKPRKISEPKSLKEIAESEYFKKLDKLAIKIIDKAGLPDFSKFKGQKNKG